MLAPPNSKNPAINAASATSAMKITDRGTWSSLFCVVNFREPV
jgi:hypothetical protein